MNRRDFIKSGTGVFAIASAGRAFGDAAASNRVRLAIVGCHEKGRGQAVMKSAMKVPGVEIAYVCDVDARARDWAAAEVEKQSPQFFKMLLNHVNQGYYSHPCQGGNAGFASYRLCGLSTTTGRNIPGKENHL